MTDLEKYELVNKCETRQALKDAIMAFAEEDGSIQGRTRNFNATQMAENVDRVVDKQLIPNVLTREFGIRQQALYLCFYNAE